MVLNQQWLLVLCFFVTTYDEKKYVQAKKSKVKKMKELPNDIESLKALILELLEEATKSRNSKVAWSFGVE